MAARSASSTSTPLGRMHEQRAETVILCRYTFENVRLLFLSGGRQAPGRARQQRRPARQALDDQDVPACRRLLPGRSSSTGTPGRRRRALSWTTSSAPSSTRGRRVDSSAARRWARRTSSCRSRSPRDPAARRAALGAGLQGAPARVAAPRRRPHPTGGALVRTNFLDLDPHRRDRAGLGLPVLRVTYDLRENERRIAAVLRRQGGRDPAGDGRDQDLARSGFHRRRQQPRSRRRPHERRPRGRRGRPRPARPRHARVSTSSAAPRCRPARASTRR